MTNEPIEEHDPAVCAGLFARGADDVDACVLCTRPRQEHVEAEQAQRVIDYAVAPLKRLAERPLS